MQHLTARCGACDSAVPSGSRKAQEMPCVRGRWLMAALLLLVPCSSAFAQTSTTEFLPEIDANFKLNSNVRLLFQAKETREGGDPTQAEVGPSVEFYLKPLLRLKDVTRFDLDDAKSRPLVLAVGYRAVVTPGKPTTNRLEPVATIHVPITAGILISDRNRA